MKNTDIASKIRNIFDENNGKYGVRRGFQVNYKRMQRIIHPLGLSGKRPKEQYHPYRGEVGKTAENIVR